ncbi:hypothetical protein [Plantactinospora sp. B5E13]|uniref:hypothetical protein n=1 Tax=Plantactinospora sp. B5E13 TaxID=3153758 RepID=UPI00325FDF65
MANGYRPTVDTLPRTRYASRLARWRGGRLLHPRGMSFFDPAGNHCSELRPRGVAPWLRTVSYPYSQRVRGAARDQNSLP